MSFSGEFSKAIKKRRKELRLTQAKVAERCEMSVRGYQKVERGEVAPNFETAARIAWALHLSLDELVSKVCKQETAMV